MDVGFWGLGIGVWGWGLGIGFLDSCFLNLVAGFEFLVMVFGIQGRHANLVRSADANLPVETPWLRDQNALLVPTWYKLAAARFWV